MKTSRIFLILLIVLVGLIISAGCGSNNDITAPDNGDDPSTPDTLDANIPDTPADADPEELINLANATRENGFLDEAIKLYQQAIQINQNLVDAHIGLGFIYLSQKKFDLAKISLDKAYNLKVDNPKVHEGYARFYLSRDNWRQAKLHVNFAISLSEGDTTYQTSLVHLQILIGVYQAMEVIKTNSSSYREIEAAVNVIKKANVNRLPIWLKNDVLMARILFTAAEGSARIYDDFTSHAFLSSGSRYDQGIIELVKQSKVINLNYNPIKTLIGVPITPEMKLVDTLIPGKVNPDGGQIWLIFNQDCTINIAVKTVPVFQHVFPIERRHNMLGIYFDKDPRQKVIPGKQYTLITRVEGVDSKVISEFETLFYFE